MQNTQYNNLTLYEGQDIFNPLIVENTNTEEIDRLIHNNDIASVGLATELKSGTVHALTRVAHEDAPMFRFVATSRFDVGDTFTVDGIQVTALLSDGTTLSDGAYAINANVLCCLTGTVLTMYTVPGAIQTAQNALKLGGELPSYYGTAQDTQTALNTANAAGLLANQLSSNLTDLIVGSIPIGSTSITLTDTKITTNSIIDIYFKDKVLAPTNVTVTNGQIVIEIEAEDTVTEVGVRAM